MTAWWKEGVKFSCQPECGKCCDQPGGVVFLTKQDALVMAQHFVISFEDFIEKYCTKSRNGRIVLKSDDETGVCIFLNQQKQCTTYHARPSQCRAFPWWGENLRSEQSWQHTKSLCPGIDGEDALIVDGKTIRLHILADREASKGFRL